MRGTNTQLETAVFHFQDLFGSFEFDQVSNKYSSSNSRIKVGKLWPGGHMRLMTLLYSVHRVTIR